MASQPGTYGVVPQKVDLTPKRHHGYAVLLFIMGTLFPPLAVAARFGIGKDFWINIVLTICGYIPGHVHNFYIQNIRNNKTKARTPKWVQKYGLVDTSEIKRKERKSQWARRYNDRLPHSVLEGQPLEDGQEAGSSVDLSAENGRPPKQTNGELWRPDDEQYYNAGQSSDASSSGRWRYPANFQDVEPLESPKKSKKKDKKDRWERTQDAYSMASEGESNKKKKKKKKKRGTETASNTTNDSGDAFPEDPEGGLYGGQRAAVASSEPAATQNKPATDTIFDHEF